MKASLLAAAVAFSLIIPAHSATKSSGTQTPSQISAFAGTHNGIVILSGGGTGIPGTTTGSFHASKKKESGKLTLSSLISQSSTSVALGEQYTFNKKRVSYIFSESFTGTSLVGSGSGSARIHKNIIRYSLVFTVSGQTIPVQGTIKLAKNHHITVNETLFISGTPLAITYQLGGKKPKK